MKRILLACSIIAASCTFSYAQTAVPQPPTVSKTEFTAQSAQLNTLLNAKKNTEAQAKWEEVHKIMINGLAVTKYKMRDAHEARNQEQINKLQEVMVKQRNLYSEILQMARGDMAANKTQISEKLKEFGSTIL